MSQSDLDYAIWPFNLMALRTALLRQKYPAELGKEVGIARFVGTSAFSHSLICFIYLHSHYLDRKMIISGFFTSWLQHTGKVLECGRVNHCQRCSSQPGFTTKLVWVACRLGGASSSWLHLIGPLCLPCAYSRMQERAAPVSVSITQTASISFRPAGCSF